MTIQQRIDSLRSLMIKSRLDAYLVPGTDEHQNEYVPEHLKRREWISGFTGSAGDFIVTRNKAALWTDSRYFIQATQELAGTETVLLKAGFIDFPDLFSWVQKELSSGQAIGIDPRLVSFEDANAQKNKLANSNIRLVFHAANLVDRLWKDKPAPVTDPVVVHPVERCGEEFWMKIGHLREKMSEAKCDAHVLTSLDSIAWLFNIRGNDIAYNPLAIAYAIITLNDALLFIDEKKISQDLKKHFNDRVTIFPYGQFHSFLGKKAARFSNVWLDPKRTDYFTGSIVSRKTRLNANESPVYYFKSLKNDVEIESIRRTMVDDGRAMVRFLSWLDASVHNGSITELDAAAQLEEFRRESGDYKGPSFHTIAGFGHHGAIVHYSASKSSNIPIRAPGLLLLDSGGHYAGGTTDITRTIAIGTPTQEQKARYTLVLKGHIALACAVFPKGTKGVQLDILARKALWDSCLDYGHGTGHGVGFYLNVHEGPQSISPSKLASPGLEPGMLVTDEPGFYKEGEYGIRIENILLVVPWKQKSECDAPFYKFEALTLCPYERRLIVTSLLTREEIEYIDSYHERVRKSILPLLAHEKSGDWLVKNTEPLGRPTA